MSTFRTIHAALGLLSVGAMFMATGPAGAEATATRDTAAPASS